MCGLGVADNPNRANMAAPGVWVIQASLLTINQTSLPPPLPRPWLPRSRPAAKITPRVVQITPLAAKITPRAANITPQVAKITLLAAKTTPLAAMIAPRRQDHA